MNKKLLTCMMLALALAACGKAEVPATTATVETAEPEVTETAETTVDLEQFRTDFIGDNSKVVGIASNQKYPEGYSYDSVELQTTDYPYELKVFLKKDDSVKPLYNELDENANQAFDLIGNMDMLTYMLGDDYIVAQYTKDESGQVQPSPYNYSSVIDRIVEQYADENKEPLDWSSTAELKENADAIIKMAEDSTGRYKVYGVISKEEGTYGLILNDNLYSDDNNMNHAYVRWYHSEDPSITPSLEWKGETLYLNYQEPDGDSYKDVTAEVLCGFETGTMDLMFEE